MFDLPITRALRTLLPAAIALLALAGCAGERASSTGATAARGAANADSMSAAFTNDTHVAAADARLVNLEIGGMTCMACVTKVGHALQSVPGVDSVNVSLAGRTAVVRCRSDVPGDSLVAAVRRAGPEYLGLLAP